MEKARLLLMSFIDFHVKNRHYPENFGEQLLRLVISLPPSTRKLDDLFPLLSTDLCIQLSQHAQKSDHEDVRRLYKAAFGDEIDGLRASVHRSERTGLSEEDEEVALLERLLAEISKENLAKKLGRRWDEARASYTPAAVTVKNGFEFNDAITAFYAHIVRRTGSPWGHMDPNALSTKALANLKKAFARKGGYDAALSEGIYGTNGGMRFVFDTLTEFLKEEEKAEYVNMVFKVTMDSLDWDAKDRFMEIFRERIGPRLPDELRELPSDRLARHWEEILRCYVESTDKVVELMKRL
jgi:hypothetical protein